MQQKNKIHRKVLALQKFFDTHKRTLAVRKLLLVSMILTGTILTVYFLMREQFITLAICVLSTLILVYGCRWLFHKIITIRFRSLTRKVTRFDCEKIKSHLEDLRERYDFRNARRFRKKILQNSHFYCLVLEYFAMSEKFYREAYE